jgi:50S ribosomal subunit-associated GTPase HflX
VPQITIFNKIDLTDLKSGIDRSPCGNINQVRLSAITGEGAASFRDVFPELLLCLQPNNIVEKTPSVVD